MGAAGAAALGAGRLWPTAAAQTDAPWGPAPELRHAQLASGRTATLWQWQAQGPVRGHILFSHGAASAPRHYQRLCGPWAAAGYQIIAPLHVDSTEHPETAQFAGLASWTARIEDMRLAAESLNGAPFIAAGHSYGGLTAIALGGGVSLAPAAIEGPLRHDRAAAVLAFSPPPAIAALVGDGGYAPLAVPSFHQSGTKDFLGPNPQPDDWMGHFDAFKAAPADGRHYALTLAEVDHYFGGLICRSDVAGPAQPAELAEAVRLSLQFIEAIAHGSASARQALDAALADAGPKMLLRK